ncbi:FYN-binding protein-like protein [Leptotrombidium deliense]|uniref:FYN-binding protein-like protein n=1 Tax=Leptotrombidium deliense TaxID=299467 RepID=A0A443SPZ1_9ACAR|nr:FYN-binding protein-like protein [Leptotrombidium deliense]
MNDLASDTLNKDNQLCVYNEYSADDIAQPVSEKLLKVPPVPKPRLSLLTKKQNSVQGRCNSVPDCSVQQSDYLFPRRPPRRKSECAPNFSDTQLTAKCDSTESETYKEAEKCDNKSSQSTTFRKFGSLLRNRKLLSLRRGSKEKHKVADESKPLRPKRSPPLPPTNLHFRPAAPLPVYTCEQELYEHGSTLTYYDRDSVYTSDSDMYATVGDRTSLADSSDHYEDISDFEKLTESDYDDDLYQDAYQCRFTEEQIYEVLPGEEHSSNDLNTQQELFVETDNNYCRKIESHSDRKLKKREKKRAVRAAKLRKKFNFTGNEIPVNAGVVIEDAKGTAYDLMVNKGEVVLILRMENNPPGKWLVKNERDKIGFVDLQNINVDPDSIKSLMKIPALYET